MVSKYQNIKFDTHNEKALTWCIEVAAPDSTIRGKDKQVGDVVAMMPPIIKHVLGLIVS